MAHRPGFKKVILLSQGGLLLITVLLYVLFRQGTLLTDLWDGRQSIYMLLYTGLLSGVGIRLFSLILQEAWSGFAENMNDTVIKALDGLDGMELLLISLPPAVVEELFFRGLLQPWVGLWAASVIFAILHWGFVKELWAHGLHALLIGLFLGWLSLATGSLIAPMVAHGVNNFLAGLYVRKKSIF